MIFEIRKCDTHQSIFDYLRLLLLQGRRNLLGLSSVRIFEFEYFGAFIAVFARFCSPQHLCEHLKAQFLIEVPKLRVVVNQNFVFKLSPLLFSVLGCHLQ